MQCNFWWFFESAGPQKRFHTLPALTSIKKYICNIKIKIIFFRHGSRVILGSIFIEKVMLFAVKIVLPCQWVEKCKVFTAKRIDFSMKIDPKITREPCRKNTIFIFMLQMYFLMLVSTGSVWKRFQGSADSKNHQKLHYISHNPLQQGSQYKWASAAAPH